MKQLVLEKLGNGYNFRVLTQPRGLLRIIQLVLSVVAFSTTYKFETASSYFVNCRFFEKTSSYKFGYPFKLFVLRIPEACVESTEDIIYQSYEFPFDFSSSAEFYVATGILTILFTIGISNIYVCRHRLYSTNRTVPVVDLLTSGVLAIFWFAGSCAWAQGISNVKYITNPTNLFHKIDICINKDVCHTESTGNISKLYVSLFCGFANCVMMSFSLWFVFKECCFNKKIPTPVPGMEPKRGMQQEVLGHVRRVKQSLIFSLHSCMLWITSFVDKDSLYKQVSSTNNQPERVLQQQVLPVQDKELKIGGTLYI